MKSFVRTLSVALSLALFASTAQAADVVVGWVANGGTSHFDELTGSKTATFGGFVTDELTAITGSGWFHNHDNVTLTTSTLQIRLNGVWTTLLTKSTTSSSQNAGNTWSNAPTFNFAQGVVSGIRFNSNPSWRNTHHNFQNEAFRFTNVPEPSSIALLGIGLVGAGYVARRRRQQNA